MRDFNTAFTNTNGAAFPNTEAVNATGPSATDGTEFVKIGIDDGMDWGYAQALLDAAGLTPNGSPEAVGDSQKLEAQEILFGIPLKYIAGLLLSNAADADHDITLSIGEARSEASTARIALAAALTKQIDANWVAGDNVGGFPSGLALAVDTWYDIFVIKNPTTGVVDAGFDTSLTAANLLTDAVGFTDYKRVGSVLTDGSSNIIAFKMYELLSGLRVVLWNDPLLDVDVANLGTTEVDYALSVPLGHNVVAIYNALANKAAANPKVYIRNPGTNDEAPSGTVGPLTSTTGQASGSNAGGGPFKTLTDISKQVSARSDSALTTLLVATLGWEE